MHYFITCAHPQHGGDERVISRNATNIDYFFKIKMKMCNNVKYISHKCEIFNYCYMCVVSELAYKLNISEDGHNCCNSCHKIADQELLIECLWR